MLSNNLQKTIQNALLIAKQHAHKYATYEHLLLALLSDTDIKGLFKYHKIDDKVINQKLNEYLQYELVELKSDDIDTAKPTSGFQHVVQRAAVNSAANGHKYVTSQHVLAEFFLEHNSYALKCLKESHLSRQDILKSFNRKTNPALTSSNKVFSKLAARIGFNKQPHPETEKYFDTPAASTEPFDSPSAIGPKSNSNSDKNNELSQIYKIP